MCLCAGFEDKEAELDRVRVTSRVALANAQEDLKAQIDNSKRMAGKQEQPVYYVENYRCKALLERLRSILES